MYKIISVAAVVAYFVPLIIVVVRNAWRDPFFKLFAIYWAIGGISNLLDVIPGIPRQVTVTAGIFYNMLDIPFILAVLYNTTSYTFIKRFAIAAVILVSGLQVIGLLTNGLSYDSLKYPMGVGIGMVLVVVTMEIIRYMQKVEHTTRQNAKMFIYAAVLFEYATFIVIYIFDYIVDTSDRTDSFIIYYLSSLVAILIATCGFLMFRLNDRKRVME
jgi:hypothetical protein